MVSHPLHFNLLHRIEDLSGLLFLDEEKNLLRVCHNDDGDDGDDGGGNDAFEGYLKVKKMI